MKMRRSLYTSYDDNVDYSSYDMMIEYRRGSGVIILILFLSTSFESSYDECSFFQSIN